MASALEIAKVKQRKLTLFAARAQHEVRIMELEEQIARERDNIKANDTHQEKLDKELSDLQQPQQGG